MRKFGFDTLFGPVFCFGGQVLDKPSKKMDDQGLREYRRVLPEVTVHMM